MVCMTAVYLTVLLAFIVCQCRAVLHEEKQPKFKDCNHVRKAGYTELGEYTLWRFDNQSFKVYCQHEANNSYTVIQLRKYGNVNFVQPWHKYQSGFGNPLQGDYWAGLSRIYYLTTTGHNVLTINMQDWNNNNKNVRYTYFKLLDSINFTLNIGGFSGGVPDDLSHNNHMKFATYDRPDPQGCASLQHAGWWYNYCTYALPNGKYYFGGNYTPTGTMYDGIYWKGWMGYGYSLKFIRMTLSAS